MKIRKIKKLDLPRCIEILEKAYGRPPYNEVFKDLNANLYIEGKYKYCKDNSFVAVNKDQVVAFVFIKISAWSEGLQAVLEEIVVDPDFQDNGIGKQLMEYVHGHLNSLGIKSVMLWAKNDERLINFYKSKGYFLADDFVVMFKNF